MHTYFIELLVCENLKMCFHTILYAIASDIYYIIHIYIGFLYFGKKYVFLYDLENNFSGRDSS